MKFEEVIKTFLNEKNDGETSEPLPWCIEIKKDPNASEEYNQLGDLIIKLFELRAKL
jgi:hypothetical protein